MPIANFIADTVCLHQPTQFTDISIPNASGIIAIFMGFWRWLTTFRITESIAYLFFLWYYECDADDHQQQWVYKRYNKTGTWFVRYHRAEFTFSTTNCHGSAVQFTDRSVIVPGYLASIVQWVWNFGDGTPSVTILSPGNPNVTHIFAGTANAYTVRLTVTTSDGCSDFIEHTVNILASPLANFTYPSGNCMQQPVQFTDISQTNGGGNIIQWLWNFGDPVSGSNNISALQNPDHMFDTAGTYTVTEIVYNVSNCSDTSIHTITISPLPSADFIADTVCFGSQTSFTDLSSIPSGIITQYLWDFGDGTTSTLRDPVHSYATNGIYQVKLTVTTQAGCSNNIIKPVLVLPRPVAAFNASGPDLFR